MTHPGDLPSPAEPPAPPRSDRQAVIAAWVTALRRQANAAALKALPPLTDAEAARVMGLMRGDETDTETATPRTQRTAPPPGIATGHFRPRITLMTLGRGDGLLGQIGRAHV